MIHGADRRTGGPDDLVELETWIWSQLSRASADKRSPLNTPAIATLGLDGSPAVRTVVLRTCAPSDRTLTFHTDSRSRKIAELQADPRIVWHAWHPSLRVQLRIAATATLHIGTAKAEREWSKLHAGSRALYAHATPPGTVLSAPDAVATDHRTPLPADGDVRPPATFVAIETAVHEIEMLEIGTTPHRRARLTYAETGSVDRVWLAP